MQSSVDPLQCWCDVSISHDGMWVLGHRIPYQLHQDPIRFLSFGRLTLLTGELKQHGWPVESYYRTLAPLCRPPAAGVRIR